jgi:nucleoside-diphosphate-sugar epimerase
MKILFIGGNGNISWHCVQLSLDLGHSVYVLNREETLKSRRDIQKDVIKLKGDIRNFNEIHTLLQNMNFDVVCDFICYNDIHAETAIKLFEGKTRQYIYISSSSVYEQKSKNLPYKENCPQYNPEKVCGYISGKILAERLFINQYEKKSFPVTIVRPAYTYDTIVPVSVGGNCFTPIYRWLNGKPALIAGDGYNLWTFTHSSDFASAFVKLIGNSKAIGEDFHISTDELLSWNEATEMTLNAFGIENIQTIHVPLSVLEKTTLETRKEMLFQKVWHSIQDNTKIKSIADGWKANINFEDGIKMTKNWLYEKDSYRRIDMKLCQILDDITNLYHGGLK